MTMLNKQQFSTIVLLSFFVGGLSGAVIAPLTWPHLQRSMIPVAPGSEQSSNVFRETVVADDTMVTDVIKQANSAVVSVVIYRQRSELTGESMRTFPFNDLFGPGFPFDIQIPTPKAEPKSSDGSDDLVQVGGGSGFIITTDGLIVTNRHVVSDETATYRVVLADGRTLDATVLAKDPVIDVALLRVDADGLPTLSLGDSDRLALGQSVVAIGNALAEYGNTVTRGVVSGMGRRVEAGDQVSGASEILEEAIQTDAAINPGNSGGPLLNLSGEVVGINTAVSSQGQLLGFAIPINAVKRTIESVQKTGRIVRPWLGIRYVTVTPRLAEVNRLSVTYGVLVARGQTREEFAVIPGSPADKAGIVENDIILEINNDRLEDKDSLASIVNKYNVGDTLTLKILRDGAERTITVVLGEFPSDVR